MDPAHGPAAACDFEPDIDERIETVLEPAISLGQQDFEYFLVADRTEYFRRNPAV
jgi:hypothetical protein